MSTVIRRNYLERLVYRSFLESSPAHIGMPRKLPVSETSFRRHGHIDLHQLKLNLLQSAFETTSNARLYERLCGAANRAAELAWATPYPLLVFPCLFEEMVEAIRAPSKKTADAAAIVAKPPGFQASSEVSCLWHQACRPSEASILVRNATTRNNRVPSPLT